MAEIINYDPEDNPRLQQIYQILLLAGYFRIRISSLKAFDKVIGGIAWCITSSNFQIEVDYNDQMQIGQKIKVSQHICSSLKNMKSPFNLQPFQLQGLDVNNIFPVVQWLIKFVYETRFERQKYNRQIAFIQGRKIVDLGITGNKNIIKQIPIKRSKINKAVAQTSYHNPIRVYSALLQFNDITSLRMYNKLHNMMLNKKQRQKTTYNTEDQAQLKQAQSDFLDIMNPDKQNQQNQKHQHQLNANIQHHFADVGGKISLEKLQKIIQQNKQSYQTALKQTLEQEQNVQQNLLKRFKQQSINYEQQIKALNSQLQSFNSVIQKNKQQSQRLIQKQNEIQQKIKKRQQKYQQIQDYGQQIQEEFKKQTKQHKSMQQLVEKKMKLKQRKNEIKKRAKAKIQELQQQKSIAIASIPEIDQEVFQQMVHQAQMKKDIFDKRYEELTHVNQQLAILQRKAQNFTSAPEIAQYHQRFVELFEAINLLIEEKRSIYDEMTNLQSTQKMINNYNQFLANAKEGIQNAKNKAHRKQLTQDLKQIFLGFEMNMNNSKLSLNKMQNNMQKTAVEYENLVKIQRQYRKKLRELKIQYQNAQKLYQ